MTRRYVRAGDLCVARRVTDNDAALFMRGWVDEMLAAGTLSDALAETGIIEWPDPEEDDPPAQARYEAMEREILKRTWEAAYPVARAAFLRAAKDVLAPERKQNS